MNILNFKRIIAKILVVSIIFTSLCGNNANIVFAASLTPEQRAEMKSNIESWLAHNVNHKIIREEYNDKGEDKVIYAVDLPKIDSYNNANYSMIEYSSSLGKYVYQITDAAGNITSFPFNVDVAISNSAAGFPNGLTPENYNQYTDATLVDQVLVTEDYRLIKVIELDSEVQRPMAYVVEIDGCEPIISEIKTFEFDNGSLGERILNGIVDGFFNLWDIAMNALAKIFSDLLLWIADGIHDLIDSLFGSREKITIFKVIFGKIDKLSINFWETTPISEVEGALENSSGLVGNPPASALKNIVSYWYGVLRGIVISIYLVMLLYIGIKILLASTGSSAQKYKSMLTSWLVGLIIVCFYPYAMQYTIIINDMFVEMIESSASEVSEDDNEDTMYQVRMQAEEQRSLPLTIVYIIMLGQLIVLLGVYYKRIFMMAFLITIFPIVAGLYVWESVNKGKASALGAWTREYVVLVFIQTFHAVIYVVLIDGAYAAFKNSNDWFIFMISVLFLFEGEKIIRAIFNVKSSASTIGDLAAAGATAWGVSKAANKIFKSNGSSKSKDEKDKNEADEEVESAKRATAVNNALAQRQASMPQSNTNALPPSGGQPQPQPPQPQNPTLQQISDQNQMANLEAAKAVVKQEALKLRSRKSFVESAINKATEGVARAAGITLGLTSGLASGSLKDGIANAVVANEVASAGAKLVNNITGYAFGAYAGMRLKRKIRNGELNDKFKEVGFDLDGKFDEDAEISKAKARVIQEALAAQGSATRRGGKEKGELKFIDAVEKGRRKENL